MIGLTKRCLRKVIGRAKFTHDELVTAVTEIKSILNSRPISYIKSSGDLEEPLTPSHLMVGRRLLNLPNNICYSNTVDEFTINTSPFLLNKRMRYLHGHGGGMSIFSTSERDIMTRKESLDPKP